MIPYNNQLTTLFLIAKLFLQISLEKKRQEITLTVVHTSDQKGALADPTVLILDLFKVIVEFPNGKSTNLLGNRLREYRPL